MDMVGFTDCTDLELPFNVVAFSSSSVILSIVSLVTGLSPSEM